MSNNEPETLQKSLGRAFIDRSWMRKWYRQFEIISDQLGLHGNERERARDLLIQMVELRSLQEQQSQERYGDKLVEEVQNTTPDVNKEQQSQKRYGDKLVEEVQNTTPDVNNYSAQILRESISSAQIAFKNISRMSYIIFGVGISLFTLTAISGFVKSEPVDTAIFGALGIFSFVAFFILGPTSYVQRAVSNLMQAEIIFVNFWDQLYFWAPYGASNKIEETKEGSERLQKATGEILKMLEDYIERGTKQDFRTFLHIKRPTEDQ